MTAETSHPTPPTQSKVFQRTRLSPSPSPRTTKISDEYKLYEDLNSSLQKCGLSPAVFLKCYCLLLSPSPSQNIIEFNLSSMQQDHHPEHKLLNCTANSDATEDKVRLFLCLGGDDLKFYSFCSFSISSLVSLYQTVPRCQHFPGICSFFSGMVGKNI